MADPHPPDPAEPPLRTRILDAARAQVRRHGEGKTNVVDIAKALGTSHTTIYRHFRSKEDVISALAAELMEEDIAAARAIAAAPTPAGERLEALALTLHRIKRARLAADPELYALHRSVEAKPVALVGQYATVMTGIARGIIADGIAGGEFGIADPDAAAALFRDAVTVFVHPALVAARAELNTEPVLRNVVRTLVAGFAGGVALEP